MNHFNGWYPRNCTFESGSLYWPDSTVHSWWQIPLLSVLYCHGTICELVVLDKLKVIFLPIPAIPPQYHKKRSYWYRSPKCSRLVKVKWQMSPFLILSHHVGLRPMHYRTPLTPQKKPPKQRRNVKSVELTSPYMTSGVTQSDDSPFLDNSWLVISTFLSMVQSTISINLITISRLFANKHRYR